MSKLSLDIDQIIRKASELIKRSQYMVALTGAGFSTSSGIPDFRSSKNSIWEQHDPFEVASLISFRYHPEKFFRWFQPLANTIHSAQPNQAHAALTELERRGFLKTTITQNIDGLHQKAGTLNVLEVHGTLATMTCMQCHKKTDTPRHLANYLSDGTIPLCPDCGSTLKPDVILFEEQLPIQTWLQAEKACRECDVLLVAGSSLVVMPVAGLPAKASQNGAAVIIVNRDATYMDEHAAVTIRADLIEAIPEITRGVLFGD